MGRAAGDSSALVIKLGDTLITAEETYAAPGSCTEEALRLALALLPRLKREGVEGLFIFCDIEAWRIMASLQRSYQLNLDDFKMVSMDNIDSALPSPIPLCSVDCSLETIARRGIELLRDRIQGDDRPPKTIVCPVTLMCRNSCQAGK